MLHQSVCFSTSLSLYIMASEPQIMYCTKVVIPKKLYHMAKFILEEYVSLQIQLIHEDGPMPTYLSKDKKRLGESHRHVWKCVNDYITISGPLSPI